MSNRIVVVGEAQGDFEVARELIDQSLLCCVELTWISEDADLDTHRVDRGMAEADEFVKWTRIDTTDTKDYRLRSRGMFGNDWPSHDVALRTQRAIFHFVNDAEFIVIVRDTDAEVGRRDQLRDVRQLVAKAKMPVAIGIQHPEQECWLIAGFDPANDSETERLDQLRRDDYPKGPGIGFDPRSRSHDLTATKKDQEKLSPKRVLNHLTAGDRERALQGLHCGNHATLTQRGEHNGLADFLHDVRHQLIRRVFGV